MKITDSDHPFIAVCYYFLRKVIGFFIRNLWIKNVRGLENIPLEKSAMLAFNHQSFLDFVTFASVSPRNIHFLAAEKFFSHPITKMLMMFTGQIKVDRFAENKNNTHDDIERHVIKKNLIGIFPEGTRSPHKIEMLKAFTGVAQFALKHHIPIVPIGILGTYEIWPKHEFLPKLSKGVEIEIGTPLYFDKYHDMHTSKEVCTIVTETVIKEIETLSRRKYSHYSIR